MNELEYIKNLANKNIASASVEGATLILLAKLYTQNLEAIKLSSSIGLIKEMHIKFNLANINDVTKPFSKEEKAFRAKAIKEEGDELANAMTIDKQADALIDTIVFALGGLEQLGLLPIFAELLTEVMNANLKKELAGTKTKSKRGYKRDLIKPAGWKQPDLYSIIKKHKKT